MLELHDHLKNVFINQLGFHGSIGDVLDHVAWANFDEGYVFSCFSLKVLWKICDQIFVGIRDQNFLAIKLAEFAIIGNLGRRIWILDGCFSDLILNRDVQNYFRSDSENWQGSPPFLEAQPTLVG